jgi:hypothetical protein
MSSTIQIPVYDDYTIDITKYPRQNTPKYETDIVMIQFLMNQEYLEKVSKSYQIAVQFYNECKEYYFVFKTMDGKSNKRYSAQEIIFFINQTNQFFSRNIHPHTQQEYLKRHSVLDQLYYLYIKNKNFYSELYYMIEDCKVAFFQRREINYKFQIPYDFYGDKSEICRKYQIYNTNELFEINAFTQFLLKHKIQKSLPLPIFVRNEIPNQNHSIKNKENSNHLMSNMQQMMLREEDIENEEIQNVEEEELQNVEEEEYQENEIKTIYFSNLSHEN